MEEELKKVLVEARARIMWGNPMTEIRLWLKDQGLSDSEINTVIQTCFHERADEIRRLGLRDVILGAPLAMLGSVAVGSYVDDSHPYNRLLSIGMLCGVYGFWRVYRGIRRVIEGAHVRGSLTEMQE